MRCITLFVLVVVFTGLVSCGGNQTLPVGSNTPNISNETGSQPETPIQYATAFPDALPRDAVQPWEELGSDGKVAAATSGSTEFHEGQQTHFEDGDTSAWNGALRMGSGGVGAGNLSYAMYRIPLGGSEPGVVSVDANLRPMSDGNLGGYYVGLADYGNGSWQWFGPVTDAHWRISAVQAARESASFTSGVGSVFVCVVAHDGAAVDVVGVGVDLVDLGDTTAPDAPAGLVLTPVAKGIELAWTEVGGSDVAGYKLYYSDKAFGEHTAQFANSVEGLQGRSFILDAMAQTYVAVSAVDKSGNESAISAVESATPLVGTAPQVAIDVTGYSAMRNEQVSLTASGASLYDWDTDGDGIFDILADATGTADVDTSQTGIIRPLVRGTGSESTSVAMSAVSVIVSSNARPVGVANATPAFGEAPLPVTLSGTDSTDFDGTIVGGGWDYDGDGIFDVWDDTNIVHVTSASNTYTTPGTYNAKLKVVDNEGAWDVDTVTVTVGTPPDPANIPPTAGLEATPTSGDAPLPVAFDASTSTDSDGTIVEYAWDWDGDGQYDAITDLPTTSHTFTEAGSPEVKVRVEDNNGARTTTTLTITVNVVGNDSPTASLSATPSSGDTPLDVTLDASGSNDPDGSIVNYEWDFDSDGVYDGNSDGDSADHTYTSAGVFTAKVRVTDDAGAQATATAIITVNALPVAGLTATPPDCNRGETIRYDAAGSTDSDGTIDDYEWDLDNNGVYNETGDESDNQGNSAVERTYPDAGQNNVTVRVTDDDGATDTASVTVTVHGWADSQTLDATGTTGRYNSLAVVNGKPAISYNDGTNGDLRYVQASNAEGSTWGTPVPVDSASLTGKHTSLAVVNGMPAISYFDETNNDLRYVQADDADGSAWGTPVTVDSSDIDHGYTSMTVVNGMPAISYQGSGDLKYVQASNADGSTWGTPVTLDSAGSTGFYTSLEVVNGIPAVSYYDASNQDLRYVQASNADGSAWGTPVSADSTGETGHYTSLAVVNGMPAISYLDWTNFDLRYVQASNADGSAWETPVTVDSAGNTGHYTSLAVVNGMPAISYYDGTNDDLRYVQASNADGSAWGTPATLDSAGDTGKYTSLAVVNGAPAISYFDDTTDDLKFVRLY